MVNHINSKTNLKVMNWQNNGIIYGFIFVGFLIVSNIIQDMGYIWVGKIIVYAGILVFFIGPNLKRKTEA